MPISRTGSAEAAILLLDDSPETVRQARKLWDEHSGLSGLLDGDGYIYDPQKQTYRRAGGRVLSQSRMRAAVKQVSDEGSLRMRKSTQQLIAGTILLSVWFSRMQSLMRALYRTIWTLSVGGFAFEDDTTRNEFYLLTLLQFNYLDNFYYQLEHGTQALNGLAMSRAGMYGDYGNGLYQNIGLEFAIRARKTEARRILGPTENHCRDDGVRAGCWELAELGWIPIEHMVPIGEAVCYSNCLCHIIYR